MTLTVQCDNYIRSDSSPRQGVGGAGAREYYSDTSAAALGAETTNRLTSSGINEYYIKAIDWNRSKGWVDLS